MATTESSLELEDTLSYSSTDWPRSKTSQMSGQELNEALPELSKRGLEDTLLTRSRLEGEAQDDSDLPSELEETCFLFFAPTGVLHSSTALRAFRMPVDPLTTQQQANRVLGCYARA